MQLSVPFLGETRCVGEVKVKKTLWNVYTALETGIVEMMVLPSIKTNTESVLVKLAGEQYM